MRRARQLAPFVAAVCISVASGSAQSLPRIEVSQNNRFLVTENGRPFFYLADTAWELFHRLTREEANRYLADRADKGFNVIQAVVLAERDGLTAPNAYGHVPLIDKTDPARPAITPGRRNDYWDHVDEIIDLAAEKGLYVGLLPTWGSYVTSHWAKGIVDGIFDVENAQRYGEFIGHRYRDRTNIIWIIGGDRAAPTEESQEIWRAMARGVAIGVSGSEDYSKVLMTYHTSGPGHASDFFHDDPWLDFTSIQSSHGDRILNWKMIQRDYNRRPIKPIIDLETTYPDVVIMKGMKPGNDDHARRSAYWSVFAGACGHTYGYNSVWQMFAAGRKPVLNPQSYWHEALDAPSARQMGYLRNLMESRPLSSRVPDQSLIASEPGDDIDHLRATRGDGYAFVYAPMGTPFRVHLGGISGENMKASWFDPRTGHSSPIGIFPNSGEREFDPPGEAAIGNDWVLVLDAVADTDTYVNPVGATPIHMGDPFVIQHEGRYYMTYSANHTGFPHYGIGYATADKPLGPWTKSKKNPIAATNLDIGVSGPGHSCITLSPDGKEMFIVYHTHAIKLLAVWDRAKHPHTPPYPYHIYKICILCELTGGEPATSHETGDVGFFSVDELPELSISRVTPCQIARLFEHYRDPELLTDLD